MHRYIVAAGVALACFMLAFSGSAQAQSKAAFVDAFGQCRGDVCVVRYNPGGEINKFLAAARAVRAGALRQVIIDGPCLSACAIFADVARERVCITDRATFGFHKARLYAVHPARGGRAHYQEVRRQDPDHSADVAGWVRRNGGFPDEGYLMMSSREASQIWQRCSIRR